ncbi:MAG TPA: class I lanthipeptide [Acidimicrobiales bacterium]
MKKLSLKKETLSELTDDQLRTIAGGADIAISGTCATCAQHTCAGCHETSECPSNDYKCPTIDGCTGSCTYRDLCDKALTAIAINA